MVHNKCDLAGTTFNRAGLRCSAKTGTGIEDLAGAVVNRLIPNPPDPGDAMLFTQQQVESLQLAARSLRDGSCDTAKSILLSMLA